MNERNYTVDEVAATCRVTSYTVRQWLKDATHPLVGHKPGRRWLVTETALKTYLEGTHE